MAKENSSKKGPVMKVQGLNLSLGSVCLALMICLAHSSAAAPRLFPDLALRYPVGDTNAHNPIASTEGPKTLAAADLNGDGLADIIVGNLDGSLSVLLGQTNGTLQNQILVPATGLLSRCSFRAVAVADFDGDRRPDVAAADIAGEAVILLLGGGDGTLMPYQRTPLGPARALAAGDFNRDGHQDLLVASGPQDCEWCLGTPNSNSAERFLCVLDGRGDGTFAAPRYLLSPGVSACFYDVEAADLDGDGDLDALSLDFTACWSPSGGLYRTKRMQIFANDGTGTFTTDQPTRVLEPRGEGPRAFRVAYLDERLVAGVPPPGATLDLIVANRDSSTLDIFLNLGGLNFASPMSIHAGDTPRDVAVGDLDGDGWADLVVVNRNNHTISILRGLGGGQFADPTLELPTGVSPRQIVLADINGDGALDAAVNNRESEDISLFLGQRGLAGFLVSDSYYPAGITPVSVVAEDFNQDGYPDVAVANLRSHDVQVWSNRRNGTLGSATSYPVNYQPAILAAADLNRDDHLDLVVTCLGSDAHFVQEGRGSLVTLLGRGDGTFQAPVTSSAGNHLCQPYWLRLGDLSGDGILDAAIGDLAGGLLVFQGLGDGSFGQGLPACLAANGRPLGLALGDFDGDDRLDIATSRGLVFLNDGQFFGGGTNGWDPNGEWLGRTAVFEAGAQAWATETEDLDGDGLLDLMVALTFRRPDPVGVLYGLGDGTFHRPDIYEGPDVGAVAIVGQDMDSDGIKDLVVGNRCAATVIFMRGLGNRRFEYGEIIKTFTVEDAVVSDMNRDGKPDIVGVGGGLWIALNGGQNRLAAPLLGGSYGAPDRAGLFLNELMALNQQFHFTNDTTPDWVEIYNHSAVTQSLAGWALVQYAADGEAKRWDFPLVNPPSIRPWRHLVVYCQKNSAGRPGLYANFELSADGEALALIGPNGGQVDHVQFPAMPADVSFARYFDGARFFAYNPAPTLGTANRRPSNLGPTVERKDPYAGPGGISLSLTARLFDDVAPAYAAVCYRLQGDNQFVELPMCDDGRHGDKAAGDGYFGVFLPAVQPGAEIEYYLRVVDLEGQVGTSPNNPNDPANLHRVIAPQPSTSIRLSELVADNRTGLRDERGKCEDWIEVMNTSFTAASLNGLALSKDYFDRSSAWPLPRDWWLGPGQRAIVFCDEDPAQGPWHATFKLLRAGDRVFLIQTNAWMIIDSLSFGALPGDASFGVVNNGTQAQLLAWPTPGTENLPIPPPRDPASPAPHLFWRLSPGSVGAAPLFMVRWLGNTGSVYQVLWSHDLNTWQPADTAPTHLGEGLYEWTDGGGLNRRFYEILLAP
jgi:hypothetical protein